MLPPHTDEKLVKGCATSDTRINGREEDDEEENGEEETTTEDSDNDDRHEERRQRVHELDPSGENPESTPLRCSRPGVRDGADQHRPDRDDERADNCRTRARDGPREDVPPKVIGSEPMLSARAASPTKRSCSIWIVWSDPRPNRGTDKGRSQYEHRRDDNRRNTSPRRRHSGTERASP